MPKEVRFTKGETIEKRLNAAENSFHHMKNRLTSKVGVSIPPVPVSVYVDKPNDDGILLRYMFPSKGKVEQAAIVADAFPEEEKRVAVNAFISSSDHSMTKQFELKNMVNQFDISMEANPGDRFTLFLEKPEVEIAGIWIAFLYHIEPKKAELHSMLVNELENM